MPQGATKAPPKQLTAYMLLLKVAAGHVSPADQLPKDGSVPPLLARLARACVALQPGRRPTLGAMAALLEKEFPIVGASAPEQGRWG